MPKGSSTDSDPEQPCRSLRCGRAGARSTQVQSINSESLRFESQLGPFLLAA